MSRPTRMNRVLTLVVLTCASMAVAQEFEIAWHTIDGGGAMNSTGGNFELSGTIGQPDAGVMTGGAFLLTGGFWFEQVPGDCNADGGVNSFDYGGFEPCMAGPDGPMAAGPCRCFDANRNSVIELADFAELQVYYSGD